MAEPDEVYANIRQILGYAIGKKIVEITQHDEDEFSATKQSYIQIMLEDGNWMKFFIDDKGFAHTDGDPSAT